MEVLVVAIAMILVYAGLIIINEIDDKRRKKEIERLDMEIKNQEQLIKCLREAIHRERNAILGIDDNSNVEGDKQ